MTIVVVNDFGYVNGGASKIALGSARGLAGAGERVILFTAVRPIAPELENVPGLEIVCTDQCEILQDPDRWRAMRQGIWNSKAFHVMQELLRTLDPSETVVHVHLWTKALSASVVRAAVDSGFPVVLTLHDFISVCPNGVFYNHPRGEVCRLQPMSWACIRTNCDSRQYGHKLWRVGRQWVQQHNGGLPGRIRDFISISDLSADVMRPYLPAGARLHRVPNFIEIEQEPPADVAGNSDLVYAGRLVREKGVLLWAAAAEEIRVRATFIGDGELRAEVESRYSDCEVTGWCTPAETRGRLGRARVLVFPSLWYETQGLVVAEAMAMGIPCVVADGCAAREWVADGETGFWFRSGDRQDLGMKVKLLAENPDLAARLGREAYRRYWSRPASLEQHVSKLQDVYRSMCLSENKPVLAGANADACR